MITLCDIGDPFSNILNYISNRNILILRCVNIYMNDYSYVLIKIFI